MGPGGRRWLRGRGWWLEGVAWAVAAAAILHAVPLRGAADRLAGSMYPAPRGDRACGDEDARRVRRFLVREAIEACAHLPARGYPPFVPARLVRVGIEGPGRGSGGGDERLAGLDVGRADGVRPGDLVLFGRSLCGIVAHASRLSCAVRPLAHPATRIRARLDPSVASLRGGVPPFAVRGSLRFPGRLEIHIVSDWNDLRRGDVVETPGGLLLGRARPVPDRTGTVVRGALVEPAVRMASLVTCVVLPSGPEGSERRVGGGRRAYDSYVRGLEEDRGPPLGETRAWSIVPGTLLADGDILPGRRSALVDRGSADGVRPGAAVVRRGRFLGRVVAVTSRTSRFRRLDDPGMVLPALRLAGEAARSDPVLDPAWTAAMGGGRGGGTLLTPGISSEVPSGLVLGGLEGSDLGVGAAVELWVARAREGEGS